MLKHCAAAVLALLLLAVPGIASAHGEVFTHRYVDGPHLVMLTHNVHKPESGLPITYNVRLYSMEGQLVEFQRVQVEVRRGAKGIERQTLDASADKDARLVYSYPSAGTFMLVLTFLDHDKRVAGAEFPIAVAAGEPGSRLSPAVTPWTAAAFVLGAAAATLVAVRRRRDGRVGPPVAQR